MNLIKLMIVDLCLMMLDGVLNDNSCLEEMHVNYLVVHQIYKHESEQFYHLTFS